MIKAKVHLLQAAIMSGLFTGLSGCGNAADQQAPESSIKETTSITQEKDTLTQEVGLSEQIASSSKDLAVRFDIELDSIVLRGARKVNWRNSALGCPKPGMNYTLAMVPGVVIILEADGETYNYHAKADGEPLYCPKERIELPLYIQSEDVA